MDACKDTAFLTKFTLCTVMCYYSALLYFVNPADNQQSLRKQSFSLALHIIRSLSSQMSENVELKSGLHYFGESSLRSDLAEAGVVLAEGGGCQAG